MPVFTDDKPNKAGNIVKAAIFANVAKYSGLSFNEVLDLPCDMYAVLEYSMLIERLKMTKEGREAVERGERIKNTEVDVDALSGFEKFIRS